MPQTQTFTDVQPIAQTFTNVTPIDQSGSSDSDLWDRVKSFFSDAHAKSKQLNQDAQSMTPQQFAQTHPEFTSAPSSIEQSAADVKSGNYARAIHRTVTDVGAGLSPLLVPAAVAAPLATAVGVGAGMTGQYLGKKAGAAAGLTPDQSDVAGDVAGIATGYGASKIKIPQGAGARMYESALKPSTTIDAADRAKMVQTGITNQIPISKAGVEKLGDLVDQLNEKTSDIIASANKQGATVNKYSVASRLSDIYKRFGTQVNPEADLNAVAESGNEFVRNQPTDIPAGDAQAMKTGTYAQLRGKYGELGSAAIESQKALARGIKEELSNQFPELQTIGKQEGALLDLQPVLERAVNRISNHQIIGIGTPIAAGATKAVTGSSGIGAVAGLLKAVIDDPLVKSKLAIALSKGSSGLGAGQRLTVGAAADKIATWAEGLVSAATSDKSASPISQ